MEIKKVTLTIGAEIRGVDFTQPINPDLHQAVYDALISNLVLFFRDCTISPEAHLSFAKAFGQIDEPHPLYPHIEGFPNIVKLENDSGAPPDTNSWHTDLTFKRQQPFASILVARQIPDCGGDTLWSSNYAAYERLPNGMKHDLEDLVAIHDLGDFRNSFTETLNNKTGEDRLNDVVSRFGHRLRPIVETHPVTGQKYLNFNEAFITHIAGLTTNESNSLRIWLANHMNRPEDQVRWRWSTGDMVMWDNRVTMHYAVADYLPKYRCMNRVTVIEDRRANDEKHSNELY